MFKNKINVKYNDPYVKMIKIKNKILNSTSLEQNLEKIDLVNNY